jgi:hypothetical protein
VSNEENPGTDYDGLLSYFDRLSRITGRLYNMSFTKMRCMDDSLTKPYTKSGIQSSMNNLS